jgi:hypothetical protein
MAAPFSAILGTTKVVPFHDELKLTHYPQGLQSDTFRCALLSG